MLEPCTISTKKGRVVRKTAGNTGCSGGLSALDHGSGGKKPFDGHIFPKGGAGGLLKNTADLRAAAVEVVGNTLQRMGSKRCSFTYATSMLCRPWAGTG